MAQGLARNADDAGQARAAHGHSSQPLTDRLPRSSPSGGSCGKVQNSCRTNRKMLLNVGDAWCDGVHNNFEIIDLIGFKVPALAEAPSCSTCCNNVPHFCHFSSTKEEDPMCQCAPQVAPAAHVSGYE